MKQAIILFALTGVFLFPVKAFSQQSGQAQDKQAQMDAMMKDSTMMNQMMKEIAADDQLRMKMVTQMMTAVKSDSTKMMGMCGMMMGDQAMCAMMMKSMGCRAMGANGCPMMNNMKGKGMKPAKPGKAKKLSPKK
ncbi:MAG: hypothetical protein HGB11_07135 [Chlorobiales bacterium]|nr:hypothetical protein [Chlorobiales bacterium]